MIFIFITFGYTFALCTSFAKDKVNSNFVERSHPFCCWIWTSLSLNVIEKSHSRFRKIVWGRKIQSKRKMWQSEENVRLIETVQCYMAKNHPTECLNNNHEFTGNLLDIICDWNLMSTQITKRSGERNVSIQMKTVYLTDNQMFECSWGMQATMASFSSSIFVHNEPYEYRKWWSSSF